MITLDGSRMTDRAAIHAELKKKLKLPDYYGGNLDALNDCLGERRERELIVLSNASDFLEENGAYGANLLRVFLDHGAQVLLE